MNKNGLELFAEELEDLIAREDRNPSPKPERGRLWELSIITKSLEEELKYLEGYLKREKYPKFRFISTLGYIFNLDKLIKDKDTPKNYMPKLKLLYDLNDVMYDQIEIRDYNLIFKTIEKMLQISISLWLEDLNSYDIKPLKTLQGKEQENYMRLLTDLTPEHDQFHDGESIPYFLKLFQDSNL